MAEMISFPLSRTPRVAPSDSPPPDWHERERALDIRASWIVEAPAGSGKTGLLVQRYLKLLVEESVEAPEQVLAITFTRKAATQMRDRILAHLEAARSGEPIRSAFERETRALAEAVLQRDAEAGWKLIEQPKRLNVRTIDSVCAEIAHSLPLLSGNGGGQSPTMDPSRLFRDAARRTLAQLGGTDSALTAAIQIVLEHRDGNLANCERLIAEMFETRDQWGSFVPLRQESLDDTRLDREMLPRLEQAMAGVICQGLTQLADMVSPQLLRELTDAASELASLEGYNGQVSPIFVCANRTVSPGVQAEDLSHWLALIHLLVAPSNSSWRKSFNPNVLKFQAEKAHQARLRDIVARFGGDEELLKVMCGISKLPPAQYPPEHWKVTKAIFRVLSRALVELQIVFAETGQCDFAELGLAARTALSRDSGADDLAAALGTRTRHLLVDEMQDTSTGQYALIERLTHGWDGVSQTVFLVGDPRQSIYRFRQARVERFVATVHECRIGDLRLGSLRLTANFRSQRHLVHQLNDTFEQIFPSTVDPTHPEEVPHRVASAIRHGTTPEALVWHTRTVSTADKGAASRRRRQASRLHARTVRGIVLDWQRRPLPPNRKTPWKIAVLVRSRPHLITLVAEFKRTDGEGAVPFRAVDIDELGERPEVLDLFALTRALLHPADRVAWFSVLRAPWCGLMLADLHVLAGLDDPAFAERCVPDLLHERQHLLSADGQMRLHRVWPVLQTAASSRDRKPLSRWVERTWRSLGGDAPLDASEMANAMRFFSLLDDIEAQGGPIDLALLRQTMKRLFAEPATNPKAVDLLTIHGAKGLEWDAVIVPALEKRSPGDQTKLLNWMEVDSDSNRDGMSSVVLAPIAPKGVQPQEIVAWMRSIHTARETAERKRLLYVACTRAREELHLFAAPDESSKGNVSPHPASLLHTAWPVASSEFTQMQPGPATGPAEAATFAIAAGAEFPEPELQPEVAPAVIHRLPASFDATARFAHAAPLLKLPPESQTVPVRFERPEGSFAARSFGNAVHTFLELAASRVAEGADPSAIHTEISGWLSRAHAVLRADGLAPAQVDRLAQRLIDSLQRTLSDARGRWILSNHAGAATEYTLPGPQHGTGVRLDRVFRAGANPGEPGNDHLWIVDYKTATHGAAGMEAFLAEELVRYKPQLETYARRLAEHAGNPLMTPEIAPGNFRLALYYPALAQLVWWAPDELPQPR